MSGESVLILIPSFNDWAALRLLLPRIDWALRGSNWNASVLIVDDASSDSLPENWPGRVYASLAEVSVLRLRSNVGHQRAIALGLYQAHEFGEASTFLVMDGDGEDRAEDLPAMLEEFIRGGGQQAVFAARTRRMESFSFQVFYHVYRAVHWVLTGIEVRVGNFSVLPRLAVTRLMASADLWNHYAAAVYRAKLPRRLLPLARGSRLEGVSRMNFVSLLLHGLGAMSVFSERISARLLVMACVLLLADGGLFVWNGLTLVTATALVMGLQVLLFATLFALTIVSRRSTLKFLPLRDAPNFILGATVLQEAGSLGRLGAVLARAGIPASVARGESPR